MQQIELSLIPHKVNNELIDQRANDGYINATAICKASKKQINDYAGLKATQEFLKELYSETGIPVSELVQVIKDGTPTLQGAWVHPQIAINLAQWASPKFAVLVSKWVFEWMNGSGGNVYETPYHIRRYLINRHKIPATHFSMLDQMTIKLLGALESKGYILPQKLMPDISLGRMFSKWLRDNGYNPDSFPTYEHIFDDGIRPPVQARLYPNEIMTDFNKQLNNWITSGKALEYFKKKDKNSIIPLKEVYAELPNSSKQTPLKELNQATDKVLSFSPKK